MDNVEKMAKHGVHIMPFYNIAHKMVTINSYQQKQSTEVFYKKKLFLKVLQYSQENTYVAVSFR